MSAEKAVGTTRTSSKYAVRTVGIDLGSANTLIYVQKKGIILREPSVIALNTYDGSIAAVGKDAKAMIGKNPRNLTVIRPLRNGAIADFDTTKIMVRHFLKSVLTTFVIGRPRVVVSVPYGTTDIEKRAVFEACQQAGAKQTLLVEEPLAAALGAGINIEEPSGNMVVNIGAGATEIAVISLGGIVNATSIKVAGDAIDSAIYNFFKRNYGMEIGMMTAEKFKIDYAYAYNPPKVVGKVRGIDLKTGLPIEQEVPVEEVNAHIQDTLKDLIKAIRKVYESTPPQLASDIIEKGIVLTGGGANLKNIDKLINTEIKLPVIIPPNPEDCVVIGAGNISAHSISGLTSISLYGLQNFTK
ncbi:MAG: rod shape-determining protein [Bacillota bacterium]